jgi:protein PhnA
MAKAAKVKRIKQRAAVGVLGKDLTRRSRGMCEICESRDHPFPFELPPFPDEPDPDRTVMACARCRRWLEGEAIDPVEAYSLSAAIYSEEPAVKLAAARLLFSVTDLDDPWMQDALAAVQIDPVTLELKAG